MLASPRNTGDTQGSPPPSNRSEPASHPVELLLRLIAEYGLLVLFVNVLIEQLGVPLPAYPVLMVTGALAAHGEVNVVALLGTAVVACLIADTVWYLAGQWQGRRVLRLLCQISLSPDSCVRQTESIFTRWGAPSLMLAKFIPGFASVATALAGAMRIRRSSFLLFDAIGAALWAGVGLALGWLFANAIEDIMNTLAALGRWGLGLVALAGLAFIAAKWWQRRQVELQLRMDRMSVASLAELVDAGEQPMIVDVRSALSAAEGRIPGAIAAPGETVPEALERHAREALVVVYCACPNDASAVMAAHRLLKRGFKQVRPLAGGIDAWVAAGRDLELVEEVPLQLPADGTKPQVSRVAP
ncbi:DedA family protein/thiosulfate sulfurtransferase GlpE [soil metagenome]